MTHYQLALMLTKMVRDLVYLQIENFRHQEAAALVSCSEQIILIQKLRSWANAVEEKIPKEKA